MGTRTDNGDGNAGRIGEYELDFLELLSAAPILCQHDPASSAVAQAVSHNDCRSMLLNRGDDESGKLRRHEGDCVGSDLLPLGERSTYANCNIDLK